MEAGRGGLVNPLGRSGLKQQEGPGSGSLKPRLCLSHHRTRLWREARARRGRPAPAAPEPRTAPALPGRDALGTTEAARCSYHLWDSLPTPNAAFMILERGRDRETSVERERSFGCLPPAPQTG